MARNTPTIKKGKLFKDPLKGQENFFKDAASEQIETTFDAETLARMRAYVKKRSLLKIQELIRLSVGFFLNNQGF